MNHLKHSVLLFFTLIPAVFAPASVNADTVIVLFSDNAKVQFLSNGKNARINTKGKDDYMLVDFKSNSIYAVDPAKKQILNVSESIPDIGSGKTPEFHLNLKPAGNGPTIAGYATNKYRISAQGADCGTIYGSREALNGTRSVKEMFDTMKTMADNHRKSLGGFASAIPPCQLARMELANHVDKIGAPLKTIDKDGRVETEVLSINHNANVEASNYALPSNYKRISMADKIEEATRSSQEMDRMQQQMPDMQQMMRQMQETGQLPPEAVEQMKRYEEMMRRR